MSNICYGVICYYEIDLCYYGCKFYTIAGNVKGKVKDLLTYTW